jgi:serine/threonine-protein kinase
MAKARQVGRFEIVREIRRESLGTVYDASDHKFGRTVSLKLPHDELRDDEEARARLEQEAKLLARLSHVSAPAAYELGYTEDLVPYFSFEHLHGESLETYLAGKVSLLDRLTLLEQACLGADYLHRQELVHRHLKPFNLFVTNERIVKLLDFAFARWIRGMGPTGLVVGAPDYMAPEQMKGLPLNGRADIYSLGVVLYELLTKRKPFSGENVQATFFATLHVDPPRLKEPEAGTTKAFQEVVDRALQKNPRDRFPSAAEMAQAVRSLIEGIAKELPDFTTFDVV